MEIKDCDWNILSFVKKKKWVGFFEIHKLVYPRLVRAFFSVIEVNHKNFSVKATIKGTKILIS